MFKGNNYLRYVYYCLFEYFFCVLMCYLKGCVFLCVFSVCMYVCMCEVVLMTRNIKDLENYH